MRQRGVFLLAAALVLTSLAGCGAQSANVEATVAAGIAATTAAQQSATPLLPATGTPTPAVGAWEVLQETSSFDDSATVVLSLRANEPVKGWTVTYTPALLLRCKERRTEAYIVTGMPADFVTGDLDHAKARIRLDDAPAESLRMARATDDKSLFFLDAVAIIKRLADAERLLFGFTPFNASPVETSFDLTGLRAALPPLTEACQSALLPTKEPIATLAPLPELARPFYTTPRGGRRLADTPGTSAEGGRVCGSAQLKVIAQQRVEGKLWYQVEVAEVPPCDLTAPLAAVGDIGWIAAEGVTVQSPNAP